LAEGWDGRLLAHRFAWDVIAHRVRQAAVNRAHSKRFATSQPAREAARPWERRLDQIAVATDLTASAATATINPARREGAKA